VAISRIRNKQSKPGTRIPKGKKIKIKKYTTLIPRQDNITFGASQKMMTYSCEFAVGLEFTVSGPPVESEQDNTFGWQNVVKT